MGNNDCSGGYRTFRGGGDSNDSGTIESYDWSFSGGISRSGKSVTFSCGADGPCPSSGTLTVTDSLGLKDSATASCNYDNSGGGGGGGDGSGGGGGSSNSAPTAQGDSYIITQGQTLTVDTNNDVLENDNDDDSDSLTASKISDPSDGKTSNFTSGGTFAYTPKSGFTGRDTFKYEVSDTENNTAQASVNIDVREAVTNSSVTWTINVFTNEPPNAAFTVTGTKTVGSRLEFDASNSSDPDSGDSITSYQWDFKDGTNQTVPTSVINPVTDPIDHTFAATGTYPVELTVTDENAATDTAVKNVTIGAQPDFSLVPQSQTIWTVANAVGRSSEAVVELDGLTNVTPADITVSAQGSGIPPGNIDPELDPANKEITVSVESGGVDPGTYTIELTASAPNPAGGEITKTANITVRAQNFQEF